MRTSERVLFDFDADWPERPALDLGQLARAVQAHALQIALFAVVVAVVVFAVSRTASDRYRATARLVASPSSLSSGGEPDDRSLATSLVLARTPAVRAQAAREVPGESAASIGDKISARVETGAAVIDIAATDDDPDRAAAVANAVARAFLEERAAQNRAVAARTRALLIARLDRLSAGAADAPEAAAIRRRLGDLAATQATSASDLSVGEPAQVPSSAVAPRPARYAFAGFLVAITLAVLAVVVREYLRHARSTARGAEDGLPILARFPSAGHRARLGRRERGRAGEDDARRSLCSAVLLALPPGQRHVVLTTSPGPHEGSARVAAGLARSLAEVHPGTLAFSADAADLPGGAPDVADAGYVVVDAPGLLTAPEPWLVGHYADAVVLVHPERIPEDELAAAREALDRLGTRVLGAVVAE